MPETLGAQSILLMGSPGSGKTYSITTLIEAGLEVFVIITEPNGLDTLLDAMARKNLPMEKLHWHVIAPMPTSISILKEQAQKINTMGYEDLGKIKTGISKREATQYMDLLKQIENFTDQRTGNSYGSITSWSSDRAFVLDSLTGINIMVQDCTVGSKPTMHQGEYGVAMNAIHRLVITLTSLDCYFVLMAHIDRVVDPVRGGTFIMLSALGQKLAPKLPAPFSECILAVRDGSNYYWSTATPNVDTKSRALAISAQLKPSFVPIVETGKKRAELVAASKPKQVPNPNQAA
jgi:hypothetical protein